MCSLNYLVKGSKQLSYKKKNRFKQFTDTHLKGEKLKTNIKKNGKKKISKMEKKKKQKKERIDKRPTVTDSTSFRRYRKKKT
jgi:hypothetical protein